MTTLKIEVEELCAKRRAEGSCGHRRSGRRRRSSRTSRRRERMSGVDWNGVAEVEIPKTHEKDNNSVSNHVYFDDHRV